ncbi:dipeptidase PepE [Pseudidiomarina terrestris]|uniref:Dipeptidase PepE n=1 Tax=Pseudidiomarina terrestris TaxID=2820060 RepID=A0AAW7QTQ6_9GAMM|nr:MULTISPECIES: dipeptidase PepE [unclassified Pseudidiomarina]MDN7123656.1 dipeptidase PepE [Pseudidiomarina sp. 1APP75-32.1]MDN7126554.1 dipeptidase PepE [Pseudidiomarina sp. 1APR75-33.1]MDN7128620.1 dipeptidase PepE [Pseudidiomarina sp. 1APR75-15]MDN7135121.1 dipeptidase PepE [Pseudidiomarina sp. 1ASP75-5]
MNQRKILLCSSSKVADSDYLEPVIPQLLRHLHEQLDAQQSCDVLFVPFAGVGMSYDDYTAKVAAQLEPHGLRVQGLHQVAEPAAAISSATAILVGGGNTFHLLAELQQQQLVTPLQDAVAAGVPYIGWSAGSNIAGLSIRTTNDMPIVEPASFNALALVPFQLNPHYTDYQPPGFHGETRDQRLAEFMVVAPETPILAIREGTALQIIEDQMTLLGSEDGFVFQGGHKAQLPCNTDISSWLAGK